MPSRYTRFLKYGLVAAVLVAAVGWASHAGRERGGARAGLVAPSAIAVDVAEVPRREVQVWTEFAGRIEAAQRIELRSRVTGQLLVAHFVEGARVEAGDLLLSIDPAPFEAEVDRAEAQVLAARAQADYRRKEWQRAARLWREHAIAQRDLEERQFAADDAQAGLRAAQAALRAARLNLDYTQIRAPIAGRVGRLEVNAGNLVDAGPDGPVLTTLVSVSPARVAFQADEGAVQRALADLGVDAADPAQWRRVPVQVGTGTAPDTLLSGHLQLVDTQVDGGSGTVRVRAEFDNADDRLMPGQFARVRLGQAARQARVLVSERAIGVDQDKRYVLVVDGAGTLAYREVRLGGNADGLRVVLGGLDAGERVVVNGLHRVRPGVRVDPRPVAMEARLQ